jgi:signal peptide peptidase SppA
MSGDTAVIRVHGVMLKDPSWNDEVSTVAIGEAIRAAAADPTVKNILLDIDSPGGSAAGLVQLSAAVSAAKASKPIIAQSSGMIASAAYFLASGCDKIYAARGDLIGSIGTRLHVYDFSQLFSNIGVKSVPIDTGPLKSAGAFGTELNEEQKAYFQTIVDGFQSEFEAVVKAGRGFDSDQYAAVATGGVFHVAEARSLGLIDGTRTFEESLAQMPKRRSPQKGSKQMSEQNTQNDNEPKAATLAELKENLPGASSDFIVDQLDKKATLTQAMKAHFAKQAEEKAQLEKDKADAEARADEAEKKAQANAKTDPHIAPKARGNKVTPVQTGSDQSGDAEPVDYKQMAVELMEKKKIRWSQACLEIKRKYPDARIAFGAPPKE